MTNKNIGQVIEILRQGIKDLPDPSVTMVSKKWRSPFLVLISCVLSLRTKDSTTIPASERLFKLADTPQAFLKLTAKQIEGAIYPVGFYRTKARNILGICRDITGRFDGKVPSDIDTLMTMKGVGRKTANLVVTEGFGLPGICVDTHVHRISNRFGYVATKHPDQTEFALRKKLPTQFWIEYNCLLVVWGQNICRPISPLCSRCGVAKYCRRKGVAKHR
ncbi:MAG TPA: endonuclease III [Candidatus Omnitrophota bacterium]|nr:endonuclease III [Candidatus Omnitrophota bacterium]